jgi:hypothetical protein
MSSPLVEYYRCPANLISYELSGSIASDAGYFRFGQDAICYGRTASGYRTRHADALLFNAALDFQSADSTVLLPFSPAEILDNLRLERYVKSGKPSEWSWRQRLLRDAYYWLRPAMGVGLRKYLQRLHSRRWRHAGFPRWPVDTSVEQFQEMLLFTLMKAQGVQRMPFIWFWPRGAESCVVMTHDVEDQAGYEFCDELMDINDAHGIKASLQIVPEGRYRCNEATLEQVRERGFEINVQDLNHDGYLFADRAEFLRRAKKINEYGRAFGAKGFRAAVLYRNLEWMDALEFSYDMSVPNVAHLDPQHGGCCSVMPYFVGDILEIPVTTTQDYMLFHLIGDYSLELWKTQVAAIREKHGLITFLVHPDYIIEPQARTTYHNLLKWLSELRKQEALWFALPSEVDEWWRARQEMCLVNRGGKWTIEGPMAEQAVLGYAVVKDDHIAYEMAGSPRAINRADSSRADAAL